MYKVGDKVIVQDFVYKRAIGMIVELCLKNSDDYKYHVSIPPSEGYHAASRYPVTLKEISSLTKLDKILE